MIPLLLVGGGGHCRACIDVVEGEGRFAVRGIVRPKADGPGPVLDYPIVGDETDLPRLLRIDPSALVTVGQIKTAATRTDLFNRLQHLGARFPVIVSPFSKVSRHASLEDGTIAMHGAIVNAGAQVGVNCILNSQSLVEHDALVGAHCHVSTGARINGGAVIESGCFIGSGAILREGVRVGANTIIGAGAVVLRDVPPNSIVRFVP